MKFWEAMKALDEGKKVRLKKWILDIYLDKYAAYSFIFPYDCSDEWELYEEPVKTYSFSEIFPFLKEGKQCKRKNSPSCLFIRDGRLVQEDDRVIFHCIYISLEDLEATDWIVVE
jgi:hypothetical protein